MISTDHRISTPDTMFEATEPIFMEIRIFRTEYWMSISQNVQLNSNTRYYFTAYVKLAELNPGAMWHQADMLTELQLADGKSSLSLVIPSILFMFQLLGIWLFPFLP